jgi:hypothetical protein
MAGGSQVTVSDSQTSSPAAAFTVATTCFTPVCTNPPIAASFFYDDPNGGRNYTINYGDGSTDQMTFAVPKCALSAGAPPCSGRYNAAHNYTAAGTYTATLYNGTTNAVLGSATVIVPSTNTNQSTQQNQNMNTNQNTVQNVTAGLGSCASGDGPVPNGYLADGACIPGGNLNSCPSAVGRSIYQCRDGYWYCAYHFEGYGYDQNGVRVLMKAPCTSAEMGAWTWTPPDSSLHRVQ